MNAAKTPFILGVKWSQIGKNALAAGLELVGEGTRLCVFESRLKTKTGRARFKGNRKTDARKWTTSPASPPQSVLKVKSRPSASMESLLKSPMKLVLLTGTWT